MAVTKPKLFTAKVSEEEMQLIQRAARAQGLTKSAFLLLVAHAAVDGRLVIHTAPRRPRKAA